MVTDAVALNDDGATALGGMELVGTNPGDRHQRPDRLLFDQRLSG